MPNQQLVRAMTQKMYSTQEMYSTRKIHGGLAASLGALALVLSVNAAAAGSAMGARAAFTAPHPHGAGAFHHFRRLGGAFTYWPGYGGDGYAAPYGEPSGAVAPPVSNDVHVTYTYDVPWDWAHHYPPAVTPSDHPYVPGCHAEAVTVPGRHGTDSTINVTRCY